MTRAEGYGLYAGTLDDASVIERFLASLPRYEEALTRYEQDGNTRIEAAIDEWLDKAVTNHEVWPGQTPGPAGIRRDEPGHN